MYKLMNGKNGVQNWRAELSTAIKAFVAAFPEVAAKKRRSGADVVIAADDAIMQRALAQL